MKRFLSIITVFSAICWGNSRANDLNVKQTPVAIVISTDNPVGEVPRTTIPISGYVYGDTIFLMFSNNLGAVDISLYDSSEGLVLSTVIDSSDGGAEIPFSGASGYYTITFSLLDGTIFHGYFSLLSIQ